MHRPAERQECNIDIQPEFFILLMKLIKMYLLIMVVHGGKKLMGNSMRLVPGLKNENLEYLWKYLLDIDKFGIK